MTTYEYFDDAEQHILYPYSIEKSDMDMNGKQRTLPALKISKQERNVWKAWIQALIARHHADQKSLDLTVMSETRECHFVLKHRYQGQNVPRKPEQLKNHRIPIMNPISKIKKAACTKKNKYL